MKSAGSFILALVFAAFLAATARAGDLAMAANPYTTISERNVFALVPIPTNPPVTDIAPKDPPPKITPNGIIALFGKLEVLFKVAVKPAPGQPAKDAAYVMAEGERQDDIEVMKIDQAGEKITFRNHGEVQELALAEAPKITTPAATVPGGVPFPGGAAATGLNPVTGSRFGRPPGSSAAKDTAAANNAANAATPVAVATFSSEGSLQSGNPEDLPTEVKVLNMEKQRAKWLDEGNPAAGIIPPTELSHLVTGEGETEGATTPAPAPIRVKPRPK